MDIFLKEVKTGRFHKGQIQECFLQEMPLKKDGWQFTWRKLGKTEGAQFYKITLKDFSDQIEGLLMLTLINDEMLFMNNLEISPSNYGSEGKYENVAGCLIAFACKKSFELGKGNYLGFLSFDSKTELISLYEEKYGATWVMGNKMFIDPVQGKALIKKYLNIETSIK